MNSLRFYSIVIMAVTLMFITSCSKDDKEDDPLIGTWEYTESFEGFSMTVTMTFNADHTGASKLVTVIDGESESETTNFTYSTDGSKLTLTESGESITLTYSISGNQLTITEEGEQIVFTRK